MKLFKYAIPAVIVGILIAGITWAATVFNSNQVGSTPQSGYVLQTDGQTSTWVATSTLGISGGTGLSTLNGQTGSTQTFATNTTATGLSLNITSAANAHTWALALTSGYEIPLTASTTNWNNLYNNLFSRLTIATTSSSATFTVTTSSPGTITINYPNNVVTTARTISTTAPLAGGGNLSANRTISITKASSTADGYLSSTDWSTFNGKQDSLTTGNLTATAPLQFDNTRQVIGGAAALSISAGYNIPLTASTTDWNTAFLWGNHASAGYAAAANLPSTITCSGTDKISAYDSSTHTFTCSTDQTGTAGGGITTLNGLTADPQTFATGTATGIGLTITSSASTHTFTPTVSSGYSIPLTASTTNWNTAYNWGNHATAGYLTSSSLTPYLTTTTAASTYEPILTKGNLTATSPLQFDSTSQVIGGAAALSVASGYNIPLTASTTNWNTAYGWGNHAGLYPTFSYASSTYYLASNPSSYITAAQVPAAETDAAHDTCAEITGCVVNAITLSSLSASSPLSYNNGTGAFSVAANYGIPLTASTTEWSGLYNNVLSRLLTNNGTAGSVIALSTTTNSLTLNVPSTVSYLGTTISVGELASADFGDFTCNGSQCTLDATYLTSAITSLNGLTGASQTFATTVTGSIFNLTSSGTTHTLTIPSNVSLLGTAIDPSELANADFGAFTCSAGNCTLDTTYLTTIGSGSTGFLARWNGANTLAQGKMIDNGTVVGINATSSTVTFNIQGNAGNISPLVVASSTGTALLTVAANGTTTISSLGTGVVRATTGALFIGVVDISADTNLAAGRSLTMSGDSVEADAELYTQSKSGSIFMASGALSATTTVAQVSFASAVTITKVICSTDTGTATIQLDERAVATPNTAGTDVMTSALACDTDSQTTTTFTNAGIATEVPVNIDVDSVTGSPTRVRFHIYYTIDD